MCAFKESDTVTYIAEGATAPTGEVGAVVAVSLSFTGYEVQVAWPASGLAWHRPSSLQKLEVGQPSATPATSHTVAA